jgi:hypothetical protein
MLKKQRYNALKLLFSSILSFFVFSACSTTNTEHTNRYRLAHPKQAKQKYEFSLETPPPIAKLASGEIEPPEPEEVNLQLEEATTNWFYGPGIGRTTLNVGTVVAFPPYAIYLLGNAGLSLAGYQQLHITNALPESPRNFVLSFYDGITSVPGRVNAIIANREYVDNRNNSKAHTPRSQRAN